MICVLLFCYSNYNQLHTEERTAFGAISFSNNNFDISAKITKWEQHNKEKHVKVKVKYCIVVLHKYKTNIEDLRKLYIQQSFTVHVCTIDRKQ